MDREQGANGPWLSKKRLTPNRKRIHMRRPAKKKARARRLGLELRPACPSGTPARDDCGYSPLMIDGAAILAARKHAGMTLAELARAVGVTEKCIAYIEMGRTKSTKFLPRSAGWLANQIR